MRSRIKAGLYGTTAETYFKRWDKDKSGTLDLEELRVMVRKNLKIPPKELPDKDLLVLFNALDLSGDGHVELEDMSLFIDGAVKE